MKARWLFFPLFLLCTLRLAAQEIPLRGIVAEFPRFSYEGSPFWDERGFVPGEILLDGVRYSGIPLQIDAVQQEVLIGLKAYPPFSPMRERVGWFSRQETLFVNLAYWNSAFPEGYFRLLGRQGEDFCFEQVRKVLNQDLRNIFVSQTHYYRWHEGALQKVSRSLARSIAMTDVDREQLLSVLSQVKESVAPREERPARAELTSPAEDPFTREGADTITWNERINSSFVSAEQQTLHRSSLLGLARLSAAELKNIPTALGERDPLKALLLLPGVNAVGEFSGGFNIRGGGADQNLILLDGNTLFGGGHLFGIVSSLNPDLTDRIDLYTGSIPAEYGGRISSVMDIALRDGRQDKIGGSASLGLVTGRAHIEGPIGDKLSFIAGARASYSDWLLRALPASSSYHGGAADFWDATARFTYRPDGENTLRASVYASHDAFSFSRDTAFAYSNFNASLSWQHRLSAASHFTLQTGYDQYINALELDEDDFSAFRLDRGLRQFFLKGQAQRMLDKHVFKYGGDWVGLFLQAGEQQPLHALSLVEPLSAGKQQAWEGALYVSDAWALSDALSLEAGLRANLYRGRKATYFYPDLRLSAKYSFLPNLSLKAGVNNMSQNLHTISNTSSMSPMDAWTLSSPDIRPTQGRQASAGLYWSLYSLGLDLSCESYYKWISHSLDYRSGAQVIMNEHLDEDLLPVRGRAWGMEFMLNRRVGKLTGRLSYTYARTLLQDLSKPRELAINAGRWYPASYDKPHEVKLAANWAFTRRYSFSANVDYATGRPVTIPVGQFEFGGGTRLAYSLRNGHRIPDYFRVDVAFNIEPTHRLKALTHTSFTIGCYNLTGRKNPYSVFYTTEGGTTLKAYYISVYAVPVPYANINIAF